MVLSIIPSSAQQLSQKVGTNPTIINPSSALEVESTTKGFLPPRMTSVQMNAIVSPATGLMVYCTNCPTVGLSYYTGTAWTSLNSAANNGSVSTSSGALSFDCTGGGSFVITITNNTSSAITPFFSVSDIVLSGATSGYSVSAASPASPMIASGASLAITYTITATTSAANGTTTATWTKLNYSGSGTASTGGVVKPLGYTYTTTFNGITAGVSSNNLVSTYTTGEKFSDNIECTNKYVSAGHTAATCTGSVTGASGTVYPLVLINGQCWMQRNLKEKPSTIPTSPGYNGGTDVGWYGYYGNAASEPAAGEGLLYQWSAAMNNQCGERAQGVCPTGFHIPSDCEWKYLEHGQGMAISEQNLQNAWRANTTDSQGTPGNKLRSQGTGATNTSGWTGLLAGYLYIADGTFNSRASNGSWRSSSATGATTAVLRYMFTGTVGVSSNSNSKGYGYSVRCLKD